MSLHVSHQGQVVPTIPVPDAFKKFKDRDWRWLWAAMTNLRFQLPPEATVPPSQRQQHMLALLAIQQPPDQWIRQLSDMHKNCVIREEAFEWIGKDDDRLLIWLLGRINTLLGNTFGFGILGTPRECRRDQIILSIDLWTSTPEQKIQSLDGLRQEWGRVRTPDQDIKWLDPKNEEQLKWAWDYLLKQAKAVFIPAPVTPGETHAAVLASLDRMSDGHPAEKRVFLDKMRKTWSQKKYRDSDNARKQFYLPLNKQAIKDLEWLTNERQQKASEIVEQLLAKEVAAARGI